MTATVRVLLPDLLKRHHITQTQLAESAGMYPATLNKIHRGRVEGLDFKTLAKLVTGLKRLGVDVNVGDLLEVVEDDGAAQVEAARQRALSLLDGNMTFKPMGLAEPVAFSGPPLTKLLKGERGPEI